MKKIITVLTLFVFSLSISIACVHDYSNSIAQANLDFRANLNSCYGGIPMLILVNGSDLLADQVFPSNCLAEAAAIHKASSDAAEQAYNDCMDGQG